MTILQPKPPRNCQSNEKTCPKIGRGVPPPKEKKPMPTPETLLKPREAAHMLGISYPTIKQWILTGKLPTVQTPGGHHRVTEASLKPFLARDAAKAAPESRERYRRVSGRNQLAGKIVRPPHRGPPSRSHRRHPRRPHHRHHHRQRRPRTPTQKRRHRRRPHQIHRRHDRTPRALNSRQYVSN